MIYHRVETSGHKLCGLGMYNTAISSYKRCRTALVFLVSVLGNTLLVRGAAAELYMAVIRATPHRLLVLPAKRPILPSTRRFFT